MYENEKEKIEIVTQRLKFTYVFLTIVAAAVAYLYKELTPAFIEHVDGVKTMIAKTDEEIKAVALFSILIAAFLVNMFVALSSISHDSAIYQINNNAMQLEGITKMKDTDKYKIMDLYYLSIGKTAMFSIGFVCVLNLFLMLLDIEQCLFLFRPNTFGCTLTIFAVCALIIRVIELKFWINKNSFKIQLKFNYKKEMNMRNIILIRMCWLLILSSFLITLFGQMCGVV